MGKKEEKCKCPHIIRPDHERSIFIYGDNKNHSFFAIFEFKNAFEGCQKISVWNTDQFISLENILTDYLCLTCKRTLFTKEQMTKIFYLQRYSANFKKSLIIYLKIFGFSSRSGTWG